LLRGYKKGYIAEHTPPILIRLGIAPEPLLDYLSRKEKGFNKVIGSPRSIRQAALEQGRAFFKGISSFTLTDIDKPTNTTHISSR